MTPLSPLELNALVFSLRRLVENLLTPAEGPIIRPLSRPFNLLLELLAVRDALELAATSASNDCLIDLLDVATTRLETGAALRRPSARVELQRTRFYTRLLARRGVHEFPLEQPVSEPPEVEARALELVVADAMARINRSDLTSAVVHAYAELKAMGVDQTQEGEMMRLAIQSYLKVLRSAMNPKMTPGSDQQGLPGATVH